MASPFSNLAIWNIINLKEMNKKLQLSICLRCFRKREIIQYGKPGKHECNEVVIAILLNVFIFVIL